MGSPFVTADTHSNPPGGNSWEDMTEQDTSSDDNHGSDGDNDDAENSASIFHSQERDADSQLILL